MIFAPRIILPHVVLAVFGLALGSAMASTASAQSAGGGFLFAKPKGTFMLRTGYASANARSDLFAFTTDQLTLDRRDFGGLAVDMDVGLRMGARTELVFAGSYAGASKGSEFRRFVDQANNPIRQTTTFQRIPITVGVRRYLTSPGRAIGNFAWIPAKVAPFLGVAGGAVWYRFRQSGDFVDFNTNEVFPSTLVSSGWAPALRGVAGVDYTLSPRLALTGQAGYLWATGPVSRDFSGFRRIDLSGLSTSIGLAVRF